MTRMPGQNFNNFVPENAEMDVTFYVRMIPYPGN